MAIAKMEKLTFVGDATYLDKTLELLQGFQGIQIENTENKEDSQLSFHDKSKIESEIHELEKQTKEIQSILNILKAREESNIFSSLNAEEKQYTLNELEDILKNSPWQDFLKEVSESDERLHQIQKRQKEIKKGLEEIESWLIFDFNPNDINNFKKVTVRYGSIHSDHRDEFTDFLKEYEKQGCYVEPLKQDDNRSEYFVIYHNSLKTGVEQVFKEFSFSDNEYHFKRTPKETQQELLHEQKRITKEEQELVKQISLQGNYKEILCLAEDYNLNLIIRKKKTLELGFDEDQFFFQGWITQQRKQELLDILKTNLPEDVYKVHFSEVKKRDIDKVPIELKNGKMATAFESLTKMYSLPKYNEIDPTPFLTPFYLIFFGMMVADAGYGLVILLATMIVRKAFKLKRGTRSMMDFGFYLSFSIIAWGLIYGSFFGLELPFRVFSATEDIIPLIVLSLIFGFIQIVFGLCLDVYNKHKNKMTVDMLASMAWVITFIGGGIMLLDYFVVKSSILFNAGFVVLGIGVAMIIFVPAFTSKNWFGGFFKGLYALYGATSYLGDFVSYTRLMTLGVAGGSVAVAFNTIIGFLPGPAKFTLGIILAIFLHLLNMFLTFLSAYVHAIRLQFVEFFGKFYAGGAKPFAPFKAAEKNIVIVNKQD